MIIKSLKGLNIDDGGLFMTHCGVYFRLITTLSLLILIINLIPPVNTEDNPGSNLDHCTSKDFSNQASGIRIHSQLRMWGNEVKLGGIDDSYLVRNQLNPTVVSDKNQYMYCVWEDDRGGDWNIFFTKSANTGQTWNTNISLSNYTTSQGNQLNPVITYQPNNLSNLFVAWQDERNDYGDIYFTYSTDYGNSWINETKVNTASLDDTNQWYPSIALNNLGEIFIAWTDNSNGDWDIRFTKSSDLGKTWVTPIKINKLSPLGTDQMKPDIAIDSLNNIYIIWEDNRLGNKQIFMSGSKDDGKTFYDEIQITTASEYTDAKYADIFIDEYDNIFITWLEDYNSQYNIYLTTSLDAGSSFSKPVRVNNKDNVCHANAEPAVAVDENGFIYIVWSDQRAEHHIYLAQSLDSGRTFSINEKVDDANNLSATGKSVTTQEQLWRGMAQVIQLKTKIFIFWLDYRNDPDPDDAVPTNGDIYYTWNFTRQNDVPMGSEFNKGKIKKDWHYINLSWQISLDLDFAMYELFKSNTKNFTPNLATLNATITNRYQNYCNLTNLESGKTYYFRLRVTDQGGKSTISDQLSVSTKTNIPPTIELLEPDGSIDDLVDSSFDITWEDNDPDDNATIKLYYDTNQNPIDGSTLIDTVPYGEDSAKDFYTWDCSEVKNGSYYISAIISDPVNSDQYPTYSPGKLIIYHGPQDPWLIIVFASPKNSTGIRLNVPIVIIFNKKLDMSTVHQHSFYITDSNGTKFPGNYNFDPKTNKLTFIPEGSWNGSERYHVYLTDSIKDSTGLFRLDHDYQFWFETIPQEKLYGTISGTVVEKEYKDPIEGVKVTLIDVNNPSNKWTNFTNNNGEFRFNVQYGQYKIFLEKDSFQKLELLSFNLSQPLLELKQYDLIQPILLKFNIPSKISLDEKFKASAFAIHPNSEPLIYHWDFGDGNNDTGANVTHKYKKSGTYTVTLTVFDDNGGYVTRSEELEVEPADFDMEYIMTLLGIIIFILIIGLIIIYLVIHSARERRKERLKELRAEAEDDKGRVKPEDEEFEEFEELEEEELGGEEELEEEDEQKELEEDEDEEDTDLLEDSEPEEEQPEDDELKDDELEDEIDDELAEEAQMLEEEDKELLDEELETEPELPDLEDDEDLHDELPEKGTTESAPAKSKKGKVKLKKIKSKKSKIKAKTKIKLKK